MHWIGGGEDEDDHAKSSELWRTSELLHIWTLSEEREQKDDGMINGGDHHTLCNVDLNNTAM